MESTRKDHRVTVLLAGFAAFPGAPVNPAEHLVRTFDGAAPRDDVRLERLVVPVEWERSWRVVEAEIERTRPDAVLLFGLHAGAERFRIEMTAFNERAAERPDAAGRCADTVMVGPGPRSVDARLPVEAMRRRLERAGVDYEFSQDAGRYLCNETLFHLCLNGDPLGVRYFGFVHTPLTEECAAEMRRRGTAFAEGGGRTVRAADLSRLASCAVESLADEITRDIEAA